MRVVAQPRLKGSEPGNRVTVNVRARGQQSREAGLVVTAGGGPLPTQRAAVLVESGQPDQDGRRGTLPHEALKGRDRFTAAQRPSSLSMDVTVGCVARSNLTRRAPR